MKAHALLQASLVALSLQEAFCKPADAPPPPRPEDAAPCGRACKNFVALRCAIGSNPRCAAICENAVTLRPLPVECWANAPNVAHLRDVCGQMICEEIEGGLAP